MGPLQQPIVDEIGAHARWHSRGGFRIPSRRKHSRMHRRWFPLSCREDMMRWCRPARTPRQSRQHPAQSTHSRERPHRTITTGNQSTLPSRFLVSQSGVSTAPEPSQCRTDLRLIQRTEEQRFAVSITTWVTCLLVHEVRRKKANVAFLHQR